MSQLRLAESLSVDDFKTPIWEFTNHDGDGETAMRPVVGIPVSHLGGRIVGAQVYLANGSRVWAALGNIDAQNPNATEEFVTLSVGQLSGGPRAVGSRGMFDLARYINFDYACRGPLALAAFLGLGVDDVFPVAYDLRQYADGDPLALSSKIYKEPRVVLSAQERRDLLFDSLRCMR